jgi:hypothetical protein
MRVDDVPVREANLRGYASDAQPSTIACISGGNWIPALNVLAARSDQLVNDLSHPFTDSGELVIQPRFAPLPDCERLRAVKISIHLSRLLAIFLIAGLVLAPLSAPVNAATSASIATAEMSADMPCCPDKSAPADCDQCPLMAICMVTTLQAPSSAAVIEVRPVTVRLLAPRSDPEAESLGQHPPPRPPRSLVRSA